MMGFSNAQQVEELLMFGGVGFLLGLYEEMFRLLFGNCRARSWRLFVRDCLFCTTSALITFILALAVADGVIRWYLYLGLAVGYAAYRLTIGNAVSRDIAMIGKGWRRFVKKVSKKAEKFQKKS